MARLVPRIAILAGLAAAPGFALDPALRVTQYVQNVWRAPEALPHDDVTSIVQARDGYLWGFSVETRWTPQNTLRRW
jgi:ligand-binding sensor domain-containing protein